MQLFCKNKKKNVKNVIRSYDPPPDVMLVGERLHDDGRRRRGYCRVRLPFDVVAADVMDDENDNYNDYNVVSVLMDEYVLTIEPPVGSRAGDILHFQLPKRRQKVDLAKSTPNVTPIYDDDDDHNDHHRRRRRLQLLRSLRPQQRQHQRRRRRRNNNITGYVANVPPNTRPGDRFPVVLQDGRLVLVTCPLAAAAGHSVRLPVPSTTTTPAQHHHCIAIPIPPNTHAGDPVPFTTPAGNIRMTVPCPPGVQAGQVLTFAIPSTTATRHNNKNNNNNKSATRVVWTRIKRHRKEAGDCCCPRYTWMRSSSSQQEDDDDDSTTEEATDSSSTSLLVVETPRPPATATDTTSPTFDPDTSALVRQCQWSSSSVLSHHPNNDNKEEDAKSSSSSSRRLHLQLVPYPCDPSSKMNTTPISSSTTTTTTTTTPRPRRPTNLHTVQAKAAWLRELLRRHYRSSRGGSGGGGGRVCFKINTSNNIHKKQPQQQQQQQQSLLFFSSSLQALAKLQTTQQLCAPWQVVDVADVVATKANAVMNSDNNNNNRIPPQQQQDWKDWLATIAGLILDQYGFQRSNDGNWDLRRYYYHYEDDDHDDDRTTATASTKEQLLLAWRVFGRLMGKALYEGVPLLTDGRRLAPYLYKHILGLPVRWADMQRMVGMTTTTPTTTNLLQNKSKNMEACLRYHMFDRIQEELQQLLTGLWDVIPERFLTKDTLDIADLDFLVSGLPEGRMWSSSSTQPAKTMECVFLRGNTTAGQQVVDWFWELVTEMTREQKARLRLFVTGSCSDNDNNNTVQKWQIRTVPVSVFPYPRAYTTTTSGRTKKCRLDLPLHTTKEALADSVKRAVQASTTIGVDLRVLADVVVTTSTTMDDDDALRRLDVIYGHVREHPSLCSSATGMYTLLFQE